MRRLVLVVGSYRPDLCGVAHYTKRLAEELGRAGLEVILLTKRSPGSAHWRENSVFRIEETTADWRFPSLPALVRTIPHLDPDVVHVQHSPSSYDHTRAILWLPLALRIAGWRGRLVSTLHEYGGWDANQPSLWGSLKSQMDKLGQRQGWWEPESLFLISLADAVVVTNKPHQRAMERALPSVSPQASPHTHRCQHRQRRAACSP